MYFLIACCVNRTNERTVVLQQEGTANESIRKGKRTVDHWHLYSGGIASSAGLNHCNGEAGVYKIAYAKTAQSHLSG